LQLFLWEPTVEALARTLVLVAIALDFSLPLRQRAHTFLEVFGNVMLQERTARYLDSVVADVIELVCDKAGRLAHCIDPRLINYKDVDMLEEALKRFRFGSEFPSE
jgi:dynein assembly factor 3, axonemal